jgi:hypothetical protein
MRAQHTPCRVAVCLLPLTDALLCLERVHDALELESLQSRPANSQLVSIVQSRFRTNAAGERGDSARLHRRYHEQRVHDSRMSAGELLSLNDVSWIERHLFELRRAWRHTLDVLFLTCTMLSVKVSQSQGSFCFTRFELGKSLSSSLSPRADRAWHKGMCVPLCVDAVPR